MVGDCNVQSAVSIGLCRVCIGVLREWESRADHMHAGRSICSARELQGSRCSLASCGAEKRLFQGDQGVQELVIATQSSLAGFQEIAMILATRRIAS